jgi:small GTP-binding protein
MVHASDALKYVVVGNSGVGKTSILSSLQDGTFHAEVTPTVGIDFVITRIDIEGESFKLHVWDTAGQERFRSLTKSDFRSAMAVILVFDLTDRQSFNDVSQWLVDVHSLCEPNVTVTLLGNKVDMEDARAISRSEAASFAALHNLDSRRINQLILGKTGMSSGKRVYPLTNQWMTGKIGHLPI